MRSKLYITLIIGALLVIVCQLWFFNKRTTELRKELSASQNNEKAYKDTLSVLKEDQIDLSRFRLESNDDALTYFEKMGYYTSELIPFIKDELYKLNVADSESHPLVPYVSMTENRVLINKVQLLNHKWLIADFTDGKYWGEIIVKYEIDETELKFNLLDSFMYLTH